MARSRNRRGLTVLGCLAAMPACDALFSGVSAASTGEALLAGLVLGLTYLVLRPVLRLLTLPIGCLTLGLFFFVVDTLLVLLMSALVPGFRVDGFGWALLCALVTSAVCALVGG